MKIPTQEEYFKKLRSNPMYVSLLKSASPEERKKIINTVEYVAGSLLEALSVGVSTMNSDPEMAKEIVEALKTGDGIIKESDGAPIVSKSTTESQEK
jgi:hypothetical protein